MTKLSVFKKHLLQHQILHRNSGQGYAALFQIISNKHPVLGRRPHLLIRSPPIQLAAKTVAQYFQHYHNFISTRAFLEENCHSLDMPSELDKFLSGLTHHEKSFLFLARNVFLTIQTSNKSSHREPL